MAIEKIEQNKIDTKAVDVQDKLGSLHDGFADAFNDPRVMGAASEFASSLADYVQGVINGTELAIDAGESLSELAGEVLAGQEGAAITTELYGIGVDYLAGTDTQENIAERLEDLKDEINEQSGQGELAMTAAQFAVNSYDDLIDYQEGNIDGEQLLYNIGENAVYSAGEYLGGQEWGEAAVSAYETVVDAGAELAENVSEKVDAAKAKLASIFD